MPFSSYWSFFRQTREPWKFGSGKIGSFLTGAVVRKDGVPASAFVHVFTNQGRFVARARSNSAGDWEIENLNLSLVLRVVVQDEAGELNAAVIDNVRPVPM